MAKLEDLPSPPTPEYFMTVSGNRRDQAENKVETLRAIEKHGGFCKALEAGDVAEASFYRYLTDGNFSEQLKAVESRLAARYVVQLDRIAMKGKEENQLKAIEFALPALDPRFDSGIRRQQVANRGAIDSLLMSKALDDSTVSLDPLAPSMPDKLTYQVLDESSSTQGLEGQLDHGVSELIDGNKVEAQESPTVKDSSK